MVKTTVYERIGGEQGMDAVVEEFYKRVTSDPYLSPFFKHADMAKEAEVQKVYLSGLFGGKKEKNVKSPFADLHLTDDHFSQFKRHLSDAMLHLEFKEEVMEQALAVYETSRDGVLGRSLPTPWYVENLNIILGSVAVLALGGIFYYRTQQ